MSEKIALWHTKGDHPCGKQAFWYEPPLVGFVRSEKAELLDGSKPVSGHMIRCGSCGKPVGPRSLSASRKVD